MASSLRLEELDHKPVQLYFRFVELLDTVMTRIAMAIGILIVIVTMIRVLGRFFGAPQGWTTEASIYLAIYMAFLLVGPLIKDDNHLQIEFVFRKLSPSLQHRIRQIELAIIAGFGLVIGFYGYIYSTTSGFRSTSLTLGVDMFWAYLSLPLLGLSIFVFSIYKFIEISLYPDTIEEDYLNRYGTNEELKDKSDTERETVTSPNPEGER